MLQIVDWAKIRKFGGHGVGGMKSPSLQESDGVVCSMRRW